MTGKEALQTIVGMVPNWYFAEFGPFKDKLEGFGESLEFFSHRALTPDLKSLSNAVSQLSRLPSDLPSSPDVLQEWVASTWLKIKAPLVDWLKVMRYVRQVARRTYENMPVVLNMIISNSTGSLDITNAKLQKFLDQLGSSPFTYLKVDGKLNFLSYEQINYSEVLDSDSYKFHPEFLHPYSCVTKKMTIQFMSHLEVM